MKEKSVYLEALRYLSNATETLKKAGKEDGIYKDVKYVQTASGTAYNGVLLAIDGYLKSKEGLKYVKPRSIEEYRIRLSKLNKKLLALLNEVYDELHLAGYYHGTQSVKTIENGMDTAKKIVEYVKNLNCSV